MPAPDHRGEDERRSDSGESRHGPNRRSREEALEDQAGNRPRERHRGRRQEESTSPARPRDASRPVLSLRIALVASSAMCAVKWLEEVNLVS